ncbi:MAG: acetyl-CoA carboxylase biotin carboxyl carrier protein subunit [Spirochaetaceae bacterium]|nr:acetyl-CoA carboxylase biotin carboxyl carrier protein subunit [Spirochaetaceae bacterium]
MKKNIKFELDGKKFSVDVERDGDVLKIERDGESILVNLLESSKPKQRPQAAPVAAAPVQAPTAAPAAPAAATPIAGAGDIIAPMTGIIKQIKVSKGDVVKESQLVVVMEAMKMDIEILARQAGTVADIYFVPGNNVKENDPIIKLS